MDAYRVYDFRKGTIGVTENTYRRGTNEPKKTLTLHEWQKRAERRKGK